MAVLGAGGCSLARPEEDPVQIKLKDLDTRLEKIERILTNQSLLDLSNQVEALRAEVRSMRNDIDVLNHSVEGGRKQQHDLYADLDQRVKTLEARTPAGAAAAGGAGAAAGTPAGTDTSTEASYQTAFDLLKNGQYDRAIVAFRSFLAAYPNSQLSDNAQYWLGEALYVQKSYPDALAAFQRVVNEFPNSRKLPDALLKIGYCDYEMKDYAGARNALMRVTTKYPESSAAPLAKQRLDAIAAEAH